METASPRVHQIVSSMKAAGHRVTPQRLAILRQLADSRSHPSAEKVYAAVKPDFPTTSLATVWGRRLKLDSETIATVTMCVRLNRILIWSA